MANKKGLRTISLPYSSSDCTVGFGTYILLPKSKRERCVCIPLAAGVRHCINVNLPRVRAGWGGGGR